MCYQNNIKTEQSDLSEFLREAKISETQYKALAQSAAIRSVETNKNIKLHVTMIGHGVFNNPDETIASALKVMKEELQGHDVTVFLHYYGNNSWTKGAEKAGVEWTTLAEWRKSNITNIAIS